MVGCTQAINIEVSSSKCIVHASSLLGLVVAWCSLGSDTRPQAEAAPAHILDMPMTCWLQASTWMGHMPSCSRRNTCVGAPRLLDKPDPDRHTELEDCHRHAESCRMLLHTDRLALGLPCKV